MARQPTSAQSGRARTDGHAVENKQMSEWGFVFLFLREMGPAPEELCPDESHEPDARGISLLVLFLREMEPRSCGAASGRESRVGRPWHIIINFH
jgi:hypothetical protein